MLLFCTASPAQQSQTQSASAGGDIQAQWAEYYRSLGYAYYGQQGVAPGQQGTVPNQQQSGVSNQSSQPAQPPASTANGGEQKVCASQLNGGLSHTISCAIIDIA